MKRKKNTLKRLQEQYHYLHRRLAVLEGKQQAAETPGPLPDTNCAICGDAIPYEGVEVHRCTRCNQITGTCCMATDDLCEDCERKQEVLIQGVPQDGKIVSFGLEGK